MKLIKENEFFEIKLRHIAVMTCRVDYLEILEAPASEEINAFLKEISDNVKEYVKGRLAETETKLYKSDTSRQRRLYEKAVPFVFSMRGEIVSDKYLSVETITLYRETNFKKHIVFSLEDGKIERIERFVNRKKVKRYRGDDFKLQSTQISVWHKGKTIKLNREDLPE